MQLNELVNGLKMKLAGLKLPKAKTVAIILASLLGLILCKYIFHISVVRLPSLKDQAKGIEILDIEDKTVCVVKEHGERTPVSIDRISRNMQNAVLSVEDRNFYNHLGVDPLGITRAIFTNVKERELVQGGSTITQQLMKTMHFEHTDRSMKRKFLEVFMALDVEAGYSKKKILETYLNQVYFGRGAWGVERASLTYFNKHAKDLSVSEAAFLAGLIKAPSVFGNPKNIKRATERQHNVINDMLECKFISKQEAKLAKTKKLKFERSPKCNAHPFYVNHVIGLLKKQFGKKEVWKEPLSVYTNMNVTAQRIAEKYLTQGVKNAPKGLDQGALVSILVEDSSVIAIVGGAGSYNQNQWNRALKPHTAGSTFKPFVYLAGLSNGTIGPSSVLYDTPLSIPGKNGSKPYSPKNYDKKYLGAITVRDALRLSRNVCAVKLAVDTGLKDVIDTAHKAGIKSKIEEYPSLALGSMAIEPIELANAYATIARGGEYIEPRFIRSVLNKDGKLVKHFKKVSKQTLKKEPCYQLIGGMKDVVTKGTGRRAYLNGIEVAGKTGTADEHKDIWFIGMTPEVSTAVWAGSDKNKAIKSSAVTGGNIAAPIWAKYMTSYYNSHAKPQVAFGKPKRPLSTTLPFYATYEKTIANTVDDFSGSLSSYSRKLKQLPKAGKSIFKRVSKQLKKLF